MYLQLFCVDLLPPRKLTGLSTVLPLSYHVINTVGL